MEKQRLLLLVFGLITLLILLFPPFIFKDTGQIKDYDDRRIMPPFEKYDFLFFPSIQNIIKDYAENKYHFNSEKDGAYLYNQENIKVLKIEKTDYSGGYYIYTTLEPNIHLMERHLSLLKFTGILTLDFFVFGFILLFIKDNSKSRNKNI